MFEKSVEKYYKWAKSNNTKFKGFRLWACDVSILLLPNNASTRELGIHKYGEKEIASIKLSVYFDVKAKIIAQVDIYGKQLSDLFCAIKSDISRIPDNVISIFDRGYGSTLLVLHLINDSIRKIIFIRHKNRPKPVIQPIKSFLDYALIQQM